MKFSAPTFHRQRGTTLLEGLVSMVLTAILGLGLVFVCSRIAVAQRYMNTSSLTVAQTRYNIQTGCNNTASMTIASGTCSIAATSTITASATTSSGTISLSNISVTTPTASATSSDIGGTITFIP